MTPLSRRTSKVSALRATMETPPVNRVHPNREATSLAAASRRRILEAAAHLFERKGYAATSVREIAAASAITKPTLYYHFGSKKGLYQALLDDCGVRVDQVLQQASRAEGTPWTKIEYFCHGLALLMQRDVLVRRLIGASHFGASPDTPLDGAIHMQAKIETNLWELLAQGKRVGHFQYTNVEDALGIITGIVLFAGLGAPGCPNQLPGPKALSRMLNLAFRGIGTDPKDESYVSQSAVSIVRKKPRGKGAGTVSRESEDR